MPLCLFIVYLDLGLGGVQKKIVDLVNKLSGTKPKLKIYLILRRTTVFSMEPNFHNPNLSVIRYQDLGLWRGTVFFPLFVTWQAVKLKPRVILAFLDLCSSAAIICKLLLFWQHIRVVLSEDHFTSGVTRFFRHSWLRSQIIPLLYPQADAIISCSRACREDLIKQFGLPPDKIIVIKNWTNISASKIKTARKYDLLYVGRLDKIKNINFLLSGLVLIKQLKKDITLCLVGSGNYEPELKKFVSKNGLERNVNFCGAVLDAGKFYRQSRIFVFSPNPKSEGFPLSILESMASGLPVLTNRFAGSAEFITDKATGMFYRLMKEFTQKVIYLLNHSEKRRQIADNAKAYVLKNHSGKNIEAYIKLLQL